MAESAKRRRARLANHILWGMNRIALVVDQSDNHDYVLGASGLDGGIESLVIRDTGRIPSRRAFAYFVDHLGSAACRYHDIVGDLGGTDVVGYAYTENNVRELSFLNRLFESNAFQVGVHNICDSRRRKRMGVEPELLSLLAKCVQKFLRRRVDVSPGMLQKLCKFGTSLQGAVDSLAGARVRVLVVANDHSPAPVAYTVYARWVGMRTIYLQHAEVSSVFPPLDFDLSILRNRRSLRVYASVGRVSGDVVVAARHESVIVEPDVLVDRRRKLVASAACTVVVYPSSVFERVRLVELLRRLSCNPSVVSVGVKVHPNSRDEIPNLELLGISLCSGVPDVPHVAICGNSSVVAELLARGCLVFQDFGLDRVTRDYYGFVRGGVAEDFGRFDAGTEFWADVVPEFGEAGLSMLGDYLPELNRAGGESDFEKVSSSLARILR